MKINNKKLNKIISKTLNETLEEKANKLVSKIKTNVNELGGMEDEHPIFGKLNASKMSRKEMSDLMKKHYGRGFDDEDSEEDESSTEDDESDFRDMKSFRKRKDYRGMAESHDSEEMYISTGGKKYNPKTYKNLPLGKGQISVDDELLDDLTGSEPIRYMSNDIKRMMRKKRDMDDDYNDMEFAEGKGETCEQCGGGMNEGECAECGYKMEGIYDVDDIDNENEFDYVEQEMDEDMEDMMDDSESNENESDIVRKKCEEYGEDSEACKKHKEYANMGGELDEKLHGRQKNLDKNKNGRLDAADFKMLRAMKGKKKETDEEVEEGNAFTGALAKAKKAGKDEFEVGGKKFDVTETKHKKEIKRKGKATVKETIKISENQLLELIEGVILEQKEKLKNKGGQPRGLQKYKQSHEKSGKENKDYLNSVGKKMKDYLKDASKGDFDMNPKKFPMGNGELAKMKKKAYSISDDGKEFLNRYQKPGMENLDYDEIHPNEDWMKDTIEGSERTGNSSKYANAVETDVNKNINKKRENNEYAKAKRAAFQKSPQPIINDKTGEEDGTGIHINLGKSDKKSKKVNEEFDRMKNLISYDRKTQ